MESRWKRRRRLVAIHKGGRISSLQPLRAFYISLLYGKQLYTYTRMNVYIMGIALADRVNSRCPARFSSVYARTSIVAGDKGSMPPRRKIHGTRGRFKASGG